MPNQIIYSGSETILRAGAFCTLLELTLTIIAFCMSTVTIAFAHSGRTDSNGGHKDNKNKSGLGSYHYHCGGYPAHLHTSGYCPYTDVFPSRVNVTAEKTTLGIGEQVSISAAVSPSNACNTNVSWECSDTSVVKISGGMITAVGYGSATITATSFNDKVGSIKITVREIVAEAVSITVKQSADSTMYIGDEWELTAAITPENVDNPAIIWASSDETVASVDDSGLVQAISAGSATITATASNGVVGTYTIEVQEKFVESIEILEEETLSLLLGMEHKLQAEVLPADATYTDVIWESSDPTVAEVSETGVITALECGTATVTATSSNGLSDTITVEVNEIVAERIEILGESQIIIGEETDLSVAFYPADTTIQTIEWTTDDIGIVEIDQNGNVKALQVGEATITAKGKDAETSIVIQVIPRAVEQIEITSSMGDTIHPGDTTELSAVVYPADATYPDVTWTTSDPGIAVVDENGVLEAKSIGTVTITASSGDGFTETIEVNVVLSAGSALGILGGTAALGVVGYVAVKGKRKIRR